MADKTVSISMSVEEFRNLISEAVTKCLVSYKVEAPLDAPDPEVLNHCCPRNLLKEKCYKIGGNSPPCC